MVAVQWDFGGGVGARLRDIFPGWVGRLGEFLGDRGGRWRIRVPARWE
jgi:hypothetical protein